MRVREWSFCSAMVGVVGLLGCGEDLVAPMYREGPHGPGGGLGACDITSKACQDAVLEATLEARGGELVLPEIDVITPDQFVEQVTAASDPEDLAPPDPAWIQALAHFDLMPARWSSDDDLGQLADGVAAAYFHEGDNIVVLDHGDSSTWGAEAVFTLSHELVHALQDAEHDLSAIHRDLEDASTDEYLGMLALVEGEAVLYSILATFDDPPQSKDEWDDFFDLYIGAVQDEALSGPTPYASASLTFPYAQGAKFVVDTYVAGGRGAVDALYDDLPDSTRRVLAAPATPKPAGGWTVDLPAIADEHLPEGYSVVAQDELGAWLFDVFLVRMGLDVGSLASRLRGDAFVAMSDGDDVVGVWATRWPASRVEEVLRAFDDLGSSFHAERRGEDEVLLIAGDAAVDLNAFAEALQWPQGDGVDVNATRVLTPPRLRVLGAAL